MYHYFAEDLGTDATVQPRQTNHYTHDFRASRMLA